MGGVRAVLAAGGGYFVIVFAIAFGLGTVRTFVLEPALPKLAATALEAPFLLAAMLWTASRVPARFGLAGKRLHLLGVGGVALILQQSADVGLGLALRGLTLTQHLAQFARPEGWLLAALLLVYLLAPLALRGRITGPRSPP